VVVPREEGRSRYVYKYVLDGNNWIVDRNRPAERDQGGNENNRYDVNQVKRQTETFKSVDLSSVRREMNRVHHWANMSKA
jgi:hypothetical protein